MTSGAICGGYDTREVIGGETEPLWCFHCRKRARHREVVLSDSEPSYYGPVVVVECPTCGRDYTRFPGMEAAG